MNVFDQAITAAQSVLGNASATQAQVNAAEAVLEAAIEAFINAQEEGNQSSGFSTAQLNHLIEQAETALGSISVANPDSIGPLTNYVTQADKDTLQGFINSAKTVTEPGDELDEKFNELYGALAVFNTAKEKTGNTPNKTGLQNAINTANSAKHNVYQAVNAGGAPSGMSWATAAQFDTFNTAIDAAVNLNNNNNASVNQVNAQVTVLTNATTVFNNALSTNGPGTGQAVNASVTINGLSNYNDAIIQIGVIDDVNNFSMGEQPEIAGFGYVTDGSVNIGLFDIDDIPWIAGGTKYVGFFVEADNFMGAEMWISINPIDFSAHSNPVLSLNDFKPMVFSITFGELADIYGETFPGQQVTLDTFFNELFGLTYAEFVIFMDDNDLYRNEAMTIQYTGSDNINSNDVIYTIFPFWMMGDSGGPVVGTITGTISLTNIPPDARVYIRANGVHNPGPNQISWMGNNDTRIMGVSGSSVSNIPFTVRIHESDVLYRDFDFNLDWIMNFRLYVDLDINNYYELEVQANKNVSFNGSDEFDVGDIGIVSLSYVTVKGTIDVTYNGSTVPWIDINMDSIDNHNHSNTRLSARASFAGSNSNWEMYVAATAVNREVRFRVCGLQARNSNWDDRFFDVGSYATVQIPGGQSVVEGIHLDLGNLVQNTVRVLNPPAGEYTVYVYTQFVDNSAHIDYIISGNYFSKGSGTGSSITLESWNNLPGNNDSFGILIVSDSGTIRGYHNGYSYFINGICLIDWSLMPQL